MNHRSWRTLGRRSSIVLIALAVVAASCGDDDASDASEPAQPAATADTGGAPGTQAAPATGDSAPGEAPDVVKFTKSGPDGTYLAFDIARYMAEGGFDDVAEEFGTKFEYLACDSGPNCQAALTSGSVDFLPEYGTSILVPVSRGQEFSAVLGLTGSVVSVLVAPIEYQDRGTGIDAITAFDGGKWGVSSVGGLSEIFARRIWEAAGLDDQELVVTGSTTASAAAVEAGSIDIGFVDQAVAATLVASGRGYVVANVAEPEFGALVAPQLTVGQVLTMRPDFATEYPELAQAIVTASVRGLLEAQRLADDPDAAYQLYPSEFRDAISPEVFAQLWGIGAQTLHKNGIIESSDVGNIISFMTDSGILPTDAKVPPEAFNESMVQKAYEELGEAPAR